MNIRHEKDILILCKLHINSWIVINKPINIFNELIKALKTILLLKYIKIVSKKN